MARRVPSLQRRLITLVVGAVVAVWLAGAVFTWRDAQHELDELLDGHLAQAASLLVLRPADARTQAAAPAPIARDNDGHRGGRRERGDEAKDDHSDHREGQDEGHDDAPLLHRYAPRVAFQVFQDGRLVLHSANAPDTPMAQADGFASVMLGGRDWRVFSTLAPDGARVVVGEQVAVRSAILRAVLRATGLPMLLALPLLALAAAWGVRSGMAPLRRLGRTLSARSPQALEPLPEADVPAEMRPMIGALNGLFGRIDGVLAAERRFTADAAHELRTPIAAIRTQAQVALGAAGDDAARRRALNATLAGCDRAARLVDQLLTLARLDAGAAPPGVAAGTPVDLAALVRAELADCAPQALARGQQLELLADAPCPVPGDATLLAVLLRNLVDNALRYSPDAAAVQVTVDRADGRPHLRVADSGPGLAEADAARLGERFFRPPGQSAPGSGLGWSIVQRIAQVHGLQVQRGRDAALGGLAVDVSWP